jgi:hypothetical protein
MIKHEAIIALYPSVIVIRGDIAYDANNNVVEYDDNAVEEYLSANAYKDLRVKEYPPIGDQLDALFKAGAFPADMAAKIQAVKDKFPKA